MGLIKEISNFSQVLQFEGPIDSLIWKNPIEDFNTTSVLVVDETHEALLVVNGNACDLFGPGRHVLETPNIPIVRKIINIPTNGETSFPCKVFFINKVHQMDMKWGIPGEITLNDPIYDIFLHVGMCGNMNFQINDSRKFMLKIAGFRSVFNPEEMVSKFRGIIKQHVKPYIAKFMNGDKTNKISYFDMNEHLFELSENIKEKLRPIFEDYGIDVLEFNVESITVPDEDYNAIKKAKELTTSRRLQGFSWQEEQQASIAKTFAGNQGAMGSMGGVVGAVVTGGILGSNLAGITNNVMNPQGMPGQQPMYPQGVPGQQPVYPQGVPGQQPMYPQGMPGQQPMNPQGMPGQQPMYPQGVPGQQPVYQEPPKMEPVSEGKKFCMNCGHELNPSARFCENCGTKVEQKNNLCSSCGYEFTNDAKFCPNCGTKRG